MGIHDNLTVITCRDWVFGPHVPPLIHQFAGHVVFRGCREFLTLKKRHGSWLAAKVSRFVPDRVFVERAGPDGWGDSMYHNYNGTQLTMLYLRRRTINTLIGLMLRRIRQQRKPGGGYKYYWFRSGNDVWYVCFTLFTQTVCDHKIFSNNERTQTMNYSSANYVK